MKPSSKLTCPPGQALTYSYQHSNYICQVPATPPKPVQPLTWQMTMPLFIVIAALLFASGFMFSRAWKFGRREIVKGKEEES